ALVAAERRALADLAEREPAVAALRHLGEDRRRVRGDGDPEARGELREPLELLGSGWVRRAAQALEAALEVHVRPLALEVARARQDEIGPPGGKAMEHRDHDHRLRALRQAAHVRVARGLVAGHDEAADRLGGVGLAVGGGRPRVGDAAAVRGRGDVERAATRLAGEAELLGVVRDGRAAAAARAGPDEDDALRLADLVDARDDARAVPPGALDPQL